MPDLRTQWLATACVLTEYGGSITLSCGLGSSGVLPRLDTAGAREPATAVVTGALRPGHPPHGGLRHQMDGRGSLGRSQELGTMVDLLRSVAACCPRNG
jgi:hypothetical protein